MINYKNIDYLKDGNKIQKKSYKILQDLGIMEYLKSYNPLLTGTIPIEIDIEGSDLDIVCSVRGFDEFEKKVRDRYGELDGYRARRLEDSIVINFYCEKMEIELYGNRKPSDMQNAYLHMLVEGKLLGMGGESFRKEIIELKKSGIKTEPAFCKILKIEGNYYEKMLDEESMIEALKSYQTNKAI